MEVLLTRLGEINWFAVLTATAISFLVGGVWYAKGAFGNSWMKLVGLKDKDMKASNMPQVFALTGFCSFLTSAALAVLMLALELDGLLPGAAFGFLIAITFVCTSKATHLLFQRQSAQLFYIDAGHDIAFLTLAGAAIGLLQ